MPTDTLLVEIGTEELPPKALPRLMREFASNLAKGLASAGFPHSACTPCATPRRLTAIVSGLSDKQADQLTTRRGPAVSVAWDKDGEPTKALLGFAKSCGIDDLGLLGTEKTKKGEWVTFEANVKGEPLTVVIGEIVNQALGSLGIDRRMRWGKSRQEFVRPVHWVVLMHGAQVLDASILGIKSGATSCGHRFMSSGDVTISNANDYVEALRSAHVIVDFAERREVIHEQLLASAAKLDGHLAMDESLLDEVTSLVEWPVVLSGSFDKAFLDVPVEALVSAMKEHQRYFHVTDASGNLLAHFLTVSNIESKQPEKVISGNERVIHPRLSDAAFFYKQDAASSMDDKLARLGKVVFQRKLGTFKDKAERLSSLAGFIAASIGDDEVIATRAALLCKADLVTDMVDEFPDLQGIMGGYYARSAGEPDAVATAISEQYRPAYAGDETPATPAGCCVALADKIDTLVGLFGINEPPSGSRDPFALRRHALGVVRICVEHQLPLDLAECLSESARLFDAGFETSDVHEYILDRLTAWYADQGIGSDCVSAVRASHAGIRNLSDADHRIRSVAVFQNDQRTAGLIETNKRVANILRKNPPGEQASDPSLFEESAERTLHEAVLELEMSFTGDALDYQSRLERLADLQSIVEKYFDEVMVMSDNETLRANRLVTLKALRRLFLTVADFSVLQTG